MPNKALCSCIIIMTKKFKAKQMLIAHVSIFTLFGHFNLLLHALEYCHYLYLKFLNKW